MSNVFLISDTHFGHKNILSFLKDNGTPLRPGFNSIEEHDQFLIDAWNSVVKSQDKVYHLGDVAMSNFSRAKEIFDQLAGTKILIKGNHDGFKLSQYALLFKDVRAVHTLQGKNFILSHIPLHPDSLSRWKINIHGHLHYRRIDDERYFNVSVEQLHRYQPIELNEISQRFF